MKLKIDIIKLYNSDDNCIGEAHIKKRHFNDRNKKIKNEWSTCIYYSPKKKKPSGIFIGSFKDIAEARENIIKKYKDYVHVPM